jgi:hypothetical protein
MKLLISILIQSPLYFEVKLADRLVLLKNLLELYHIELGRIK